MKNLVFFLTIVLSLHVQFSFGQKTDCEIYSLIFNYCNDMENRPVKRYEPENDVTKTKFIEIAPNGKKKQLKFFIVEDLLEFESRDLNGWFMNFMKDSILNNKVFILNDSAIRFTCNFKNQILYKKIHYREYYNKFTFEQKGIEYTPARICLSTIRYSQNTAISFARINTGLSNGPGHMLSFIFVYDGEWNI